MVELHHGAEISSLAFFLLSDRCALVGGLVWSHVAAHVPVNTRSLIANLLVGRSIHHIALHALWLLFRADQVPILMPKRAGAYPINGVHRLKLGGQVGVRVTTVLLLAVVRCAAHWVALHTLLASWKTI